MRNIEFVVGEIIARPMPKIDVGIESVGPRWSCSHHSVKLFMPWGPLLPNCYRLHCIGFKSLLDAKKVLSSAREALYPLLVWDKTIKIYRMFLPGEAESVLVWSKLSVACNCLRLIEKEFLFSPLFSLLLYWFRFRLCGLGDLVDLLRCC